MPVNNVVCPTCRKPFHLSPSAIKQGRRFCSPECGYVYRTPWRLVCKRCKKVRLLRPSRRGQQYCSPACYHAAKWHVGLLWAKINKCSGVRVPGMRSDCWIWLGATQMHGYGVLSMFKRKLRAHRLVWELTYGPIPRGQILCHRCDDPRCVRPSHLFLGTHHDNTHDMMRKGRYRRANARLTEANVRYIRRMHLRRTARQLAERFGVTRGAIQAIYSGRSWRHVT
jgi:HNH endonuclease